MERPLEEGLRRCLFNHLAAVHDHHAVGGLSHHTEIVRYQDDRHPDLLAQIGKQRQYLRLDRHIEGGRGLVGYEQIGVA